VLISSVPHPNNLACVSTGGITTLVDMPLNSFPSTVSQETLKLKVWTDEQQCITLFVSVSFLYCSNAFCLKMNLCILMG
jgi:dihydroorotase-like cyclic amidohydrolase